MGGPVDLVLLFTKSFQSDDAMAAIAPALDDDTVVLSLQNGLGNAETIVSRPDPACLRGRSSSLPSRAPGTGSDGSGAPR